jgi:hypothetical protein
MGKIQMGKIPKDRANTKKEAGVMAAVMRP